MNKNLKAENLQKQYYQRIFQPPNPLLLEEIIQDKGKIIHDKEGLVIDKEKHIYPYKKEIPSRDRREIWKTITLK